MRGRELMAELRWGAASDTGRVRTENEDNLFAGPTLFVVVDGMGGHQAGEIASQITIDHLESGLTAEAPTLSDLVGAIDDANRAIYDAAVANPEQSGMGTTVTSLAVMEDPDDGEVFALANVGDSRTYLFRHGRLRQLTVDHSYVQELVAEGHITRDEARHHPRRNIVTRALGIEHAIRVDSWKLPIVRGDRFLLCSDGLVDEVTDDEIAVVLADHDDPQAAADELVSRALANGGRDNVTLVVVDVLDGDDPPDPTEEIDIVPAWAEPDDADDTDPGTTRRTDEDTGPVAPIDPTAPPPGVDAERSTGPPPSASGEAFELVIPPEADGEPPPPPVVDPEADGGPETVSPAATTDSAEPGDHADARPRRRRRRIARFLTVVGAAAVLIAGFTIFAAWARAGFYVDFDDDERVVIFRGRTDGVLWFDPTVEAPTPLERDVLDEPSISLVEAQRRFTSLRGAEIFVTERLTPTTTTTTTTTTVPPTTTTTAGTEGADETTGS
ncbi:MAG: Stp1/IreP family PP2C-type Ser/Thr phosphatase [Ilumatobacteraceae bacterium]